METLTAAETITITGEQLADVQARLADLTKRAAKLGVEAPSVEVVRSYQQEVTVNPEFGITVNRWFHDVVLNDPVVKYGGWSFVACIDHTTGVVHTCATAPENTVRMYQDVQPVCDHCGRRMARSKTIIVEHEDGTRKQVGSTCMKAFISGFPSLSSALWRFLEESRWDDDEMLQGMGAPRPEDTDPLSFIAVANAVVRALGWSPASFDDKATRAIVIDLMFGKPDEEQRDRYRNVQVGLADYAAAEQMVAWLLEREAVSDFDLNLRAACTAPRIGKNAGIVAYLPEAYRRHLEGERAKQVREAGPTADCPNGRTTVTGEVLNIKKVDSDYTYSGVAYKMLVQDDTGFRVYGNVPSGFVRDRSFGTGARVQFSANLTRSDRDAAFGFYSRPTKLVLFGSEQQNNNTTTEGDSDDI